MLSDFDAADCARCKERAESMRTVAHVMELLARNPRILRTSVHLPGFSFEAELSPDYGDGHQRTVPGPSEGEDDGF